MTELLMPTLSPTMEEATLAKWLVAVGDVVQPGDVVAEVETDKATMEVEALGEGVVEVLLVAAGAEGVKVNTPIARLRPRDGAASILKAPPAEAKTVSPPLSPAVRRVVVEEGLDPTAIAGAGRGGRLTKGDVLAAADRQRNGQANASPLARRLAQAAALDLDGVQGAGPGGRILKNDVLAALGKTSTAPPERTRANVEAASLIPLDGLRRTIARRMTDAFRDVPHFPLTTDIELDELLKLRAALNREREAVDIRVSVTDLMIRAAALSLREVPEVNASYTPDGILLHHQADISVAVAIEGGLITPVIRAAETKGVRAIAMEMKALSERARARRLKPDEHQGGSFTISNLGMFGVMAFSSIINEPQAAILSVGAAEARPVVKDGAIVPATVATLTLTCDHRALDGAIGARFLSAFDRLIRNPLRLTC